MEEDQSKQMPRDFSDSDGAYVSSLKEITLIETVTSFLEENGAADVDPRVLKNVAEALSKRIHTDGTSPGGLQDITMENSYASFDVARAPVGIHSPMQGRSVRELEEQMSTLRKENFNLKLRIYFMEEQQGSRNNAMSEPMSKQLIESKIEIEVLRKKVEEKTELLRDTARAITEHEEAQKKSDIDNQTTIEQLQQYIKKLELNARKNATKLTMDAVYAEKFKSLESEVHKLQSALRDADFREADLREKYKHLIITLEDRQETLTACEDKIEELAIKNAELVEQIEKQTTIENASSHPQYELRSELADKICELQEAQEKLTEGERVHERACRTIQKLMQKLSSQDKEIIEMKQQLQHSKGDVKTTSLRVTKRQSLSENENIGGDVSRGLKQNYEQQIAERDDKIKQLQSEVKKKTANLQNLVNKELWEKNREVERLTKLISNQNIVDASGDDSTGGVEMQRPITEAEFAKVIKRNQLLQRKIDVLLQRLENVQKDSEVITQLRNDVQAMQADIESSTKWRIECTDVCGVLTNRLEELAGFLNSLLKHKDVLGVLAADRRHAMRRAVDRSLDLSKSLNMTLSMTGASFADQSLAQLSKLSEILYTDADECNKTYNSHEDMQAAANGTVSTKTEKQFKSDGQPRKERRSLPLPQQLDNQSESEAWSEPDRKVSLARIGLEDTSHSLVCEKQLSESDSEGHAQANTLKQDRGRNSERVTQLEVLITQRDERLLQVQCQLVDADNQCKQEQLRVFEITQQLDQLRAQNEALQTDLRSIGMQDNQEIAELQRLLKEKTEEIEQQHMIQNTLRADIQITEMELQEAQKKLEEMEKQHIISLDEAQIELNKLKLQGEERERLQQEDLNLNWVKNTIYEDLKTQFVDLQNTLDILQDNEKELKHTLVENELAARSLKKELDESTLQASKAIMERTKAYNDKLKLENRLEELKSQLASLQDEQRQHQCPQSSRVNSSDVSQSGYTSEEVPLRLAHNKANAPSSSVAIERIDNPSPDLGIESDVGRVLSVELSNAQRTLLKTVELAGGNINPNSDATKDDTSPDTEDAGASTGPTNIIHDCAKVEQEMAELRRKLTRTKRAFEDTYEKLRVVNKAKAQVEKDIKNQILKTHNVLRNVRSNMENVL